MTKHSTRYALQLADWPEVDRAAWEAAIADGDIFDSCGPAVHWAEDTRRWAMGAYGRWLGFLERGGNLVKDCAPTDRVTSELVRAYLEHLKVMVAPRTVVTLLVGLKEMVKKMSPEKDWRWLKDVCNALNRNARPSTDKRARLDQSPEVYATALARMDSLKAEGVQGRNRLCRYRNLLIIALFTSLPLRLKNFTALELDRHLVSEPYGWRISIPAAEVKKKTQPLEFWLIRTLEPYLEFYLQVVRPQLMNGRSSNRVWIGWKGKPLAAHAIHTCVKRDTKRFLGKAINPHQFREMAASTLSTVSPAAARSAAPLLGHRYFSTTERYYVRANQLEASRKVNAMLKSIKAKG